MRAHVDTHWREWGIGFHVSHIELTGWCLDVDLGPFTFWLEW